VVVKKAQGDTSSTNGQTGTPTVGVEGGKSKGSEEEKASKKEKFEEAKE